MYIILLCVYSYINLIISDFSFLFMCVVHICGLLAPMVIPGTQNSVSFIYLCFVQLVDIIYRDCHCCQLFEGAK